jgi:valyl-tRNA synthetase
VFFDWLTGIRPWCISRQLWWGHRIPVWTCEKDHINVFDDESLVEDYIKKISEDKNLSKKNLILTLIIFNLISDSRLKSSFSLEELIKILTTPSLTPQE